MFKSYKESIIFSILMGVAVFLAFMLYPFNAGNEKNHYMAGLIFGFITIFILAFYFTIKQHKVEQLEAKVKEYLIRETVTFVTSADIYNGNIAAKGCVVLTLGKFYFLALTTEKNLSEMVCLEYNQLKNITDSSILTITTKFDVKYELKTKKQKELAKLLNSKIS